MPPTFSLPLRTLRWPPKLPSQIHHFSTTAPALTKTIEVRSLPSLLIPPYPYGDNRIYKQSNYGLYAGARPRTNTVRPGRHSSAYKRTWWPNVSYKRFFSRALKAWVRTRLTTRVFRTIRKEGGIDEYVLKDKPARIKDLGPGGWKLRWLVMQAPKVRARMDAERRALGLSIEGDPEPEPSAEIIAEGEPMEDIPTEGDIPAESTSTTPICDALRVPPVPQKPGMLRIVMDYATPGKITKRSRDLMADYLARITGMEEFGIGTDADAICTLANKAGPDRPGSTLRAVRAEDTLPEEDVLAGQALQMRDMAGLVVRRNDAIRRGRVAAQLKRRYKKRM